MHEQTTARRLATVVHDERAAALEPHLALVADLAAALGVKRSGVEHHVHRLARRRLVDALAVAHHGANLHALLHEASVAGEPGGFGEFVRDGGDEIARGDVDGDARVAGEVSRRLHRDLETVDVHDDASLRGDVRGDVEGETVGVVQREGIVTAQGGVLGVLGLGGGDHVGQNLFAATERRRANRRSSRASSS